MTDRLQRFFHGFGLAESGEELTIARHPEPLHGIESRLMETDMLEALLKFTLWRKSRKHKRIALAHFKLAKKLEMEGRRHWALFKQAERRLVGEAHQQRKPSSARPNQRSSQRKPNRRQKNRDLTLTGSKGAMPNGIASHREH